MTPDEVSSWKKKYEKESFPGLEVSLEDITSMMTAPDPGAAVGAKAISAAGSDFNYLISRWVFILSCWGCLQTPRWVSQRLGELHHQVISSGNILLQIDRREINL